MHLLEALIELVVAYLDCGVQIYRFMPANGVVLTSVEYEPSVEKCDEVCDEKPREGLRPWWLSDRSLQNLPIGECNPANTSPSSATFVTPDEASLPNRTQLSDLLSELLHPHPTDQKVADKSLEGSEELNRMVAILLKSIRASFHVESSRSIGVEPTKNVTSSLHCSPSKLKSGFKHFIEAVNKDVSASCAPSIGDGKKSAMDLLQRANTMAATRLSDYYYSCFQPILLQHALATERMSGLSQSSAVEKDEDFLGRDQCIREAMLDFQKIVREVMLQADSRTLNGAIRFHSTLCSANVRGDLVKFRFHQQQPNVEKVQHQSSESMNKTLDKNLDSSEYFSDLCSCACDVVLVYFSALFSEIHEYFSTASSSLFGWSKSCSSSAIKSESENVSADTQHVNTTRPMNEEYAAVTSFALWRSSLHQVVHDQIVGPMNEELWVVLSSFLTTQASPSSIRKDDRRALTAAGRRRKSLWKIMHPEYQEELDIEGSSSAKGHEIRSCDSFPSNNNCTSCIADDRRSLSWALQRIFPVKYAAFVEKDRQVESTIRHIRAVMEGERGDLSSHHPSLHEKMLVKLMQVELEREQVALSLIGGAVLDVHIHEETWWFLKVLVSHLRVEWAALTAACSHRNALTSSEGIEHLAQSQGKCTTFTESLLQLSKLSVLHQSVSSLIDALDANLDQYRRHRQYLLPYAISFVENVEGWLSGGKLLKSSVQVTKDSKGNVLSRLKSRGECEAAEKKLRGSATETVVDAVLNVMGTLYDPSFLAQCLTWSDVIRVNNTKISKSLWWRCVETVQLFTQPHLWEGTEVNGAREEGETSPDGAPPPSSSLQADMFAFFSFVQEFSHQCCVLQISGESDASLPSEVGINEKVGGKGNGGFTAAHGSLPSRLKDQSDSRSISASIAASIPAFHPQALSLSLHVALEKASRTVGLSEGFQRTLAGNTCGTLLSAAGIIGDGQSSLIPAEKAFLLQSIWKTEMRRDVRTSFLGSPRTELPPSHSQPPVVMVSSHDLFLSHFFYLTYHPSCFAPIRQYLNNPYQRSLFRTLKGLRELLLPSIEAKEGSESCKKNLKEKNALQSSGSHDYENLSRRLESAWVRLILAKQAEKETPVYAGEARVRGFMEIKSEPPSRCSQSVPCSEVGSEEDVPDVEAPWDLPEPLAAPTSSLWMVTPLAAASMLLGSDPEFIMFLSHLFLVLLPSGADGKGRESWSAFAQRHGPARNMAAPSANEGRKGASCASPAAAQVLMSNRFAIPLLLRVCSPLRHRMICVPRSGAPLTAESTTGFQSSLSAPKQVPFVSAFLLLSLRAAGIFQLPWCAGEMLLVLHRFQKLCIHLLYGAKESSHAAVKESVTPTSAKLEVDPDAFVCSSRRKRWRSWMNLGEGRTSRCRGEDGRANLITKGNELDESSATHLRQHWTLSQEQQSSILKQLGFDGFSMDDRMKGASSRGDSGGKEADEPASLLATDVVDDKLLRKIDEASSEEEPLLKAYLLSKREKEGDHALEAPSAWDVSESGEEKKRKFWEAALTELESGANPSTHWLLEGGLLVHRAVGTIEVPVLPCGLLLVLSTYRTISTALIQRRVEWGEVLQRKEAGDDYRSGDKGLGESAGGLAWLKGGSGNTAGAVVYEEENAALPLIFSPEDVTVAALHVRVLHRMLFSFHSKSYEPLFSSSGCAACTLGGSGDSEWVREMLLAAHPNIKSERGGMEEDPVASAKNKRTGDSLEHTVSQTVLQYLQDRFRLPLNAAQKGLLNEDGVSGKPSFSLFQVWLGYLQHLCTAILPSPTEEDLQSLTPVPPSKPPAAVLTPLSSRVFCFSDPKREWKRKEARGDALIVPCEGWRALRFGRASAPVKELCVAFSTSSTSCLDSNLSPPTQLRVLIGEALADLVTACLEETVDAFTNMGNAELSLDAAQTGGLHHSLPPLLLPPSSVSWAYDREFLAVMPTFSEDSLRLQHHDRISPPDGSNGRTEVLLLTEVVKVEPSHPTERKREENASEPSTDPEEVLLSCLTISQRVLQGLCASFSLPPCVPSAPVPLPVYTSGLSTVSDEQSRALWSSMCPGRPYREVIDGCWLGAHGLVAFLCRLESKMGPGSVEDLTIGSCLSQLWLTADAFTRGRER